MLFIKALANGFNICFNILSILLNAVERLFNDVERWDGKRFQHFIQQNFASGLVISFCTHEAPFWNDTMDHAYVYNKVRSLLISRPSLRPQALYFHLNILFSMLKYVFQFCVSDFSLFAIVVVPQTASLFQLIYERFYLARLPFWFLCFVRQRCFFFPSCSVDLFCKIVWRVIVLHCRLSWSKYYRPDVPQPRTKLFCFATVFASMVTMVTS